MSLVSSAHLISVGLTALSDACMSQLPGLRLGRGELPKPPRASYGDRNPGRVYMADSLGRTCQGKVAIKRILLAAGVPHQLLYEISNAARLAMVRNVILLVVL